jgi:hypothetical protein
VALARPSITADAQSAAPSPASVSVADRPLDTSSDSASTGRTAPKVPPVAPLDVLFTLQALHRHAPVMMIL